MPRDSNAQEWLQRARGALALVLRDRDEDTFLEDLCYFAQQAAERAIKAVYLHQGRSFKFTHDLELLCTELSDAGILIPDLVKDAVILTRYAVETRYPGPIEPVTVEEYQEAIRLAQAVINWAEGIIGDVSGDTKPEGI